MKLAKCRRCGGSAESHKEYGDWVVRCKQCDNMECGCDIKSLVVSSWNSNNRVV